MTALRHLSTNARRALWVGGLLVVLVGLFGMHGLNAEGVDGMASTAHSGMVESSMVAGELATLVHSAGDADHVGPAITTVTTGAVTDMDMGHLCLAVLVGSLITLLLRRRSPSRAMSLVATPGVREPAGHFRAPDPPSLIALSILRC